MKKELIILSFGIILFFMIYSCNSCNSPKKDISFHEIPNFTINQYDIMSTDEFVGEPELFKNEIYETQVGSDVIFEITNKNNKNFNKTVFWDLDGKGNMKISNLGKTEFFIYKKPGKVKVTLCMDRDKNNCVSKWIYVRKTNDPQDYLTDNINDQLEKVKFNKNKDLYEEKIEKADRELSNLEEKAIDISSGNKYKINSLSSDGNKTNLKREDNMHNNFESEQKSNITYNSLKNRPISSKYTGMNSGKILKVNSNKCERLNYYIPRSSISIQVNRKLKLTEVSIISQKTGRVKLVLQGNRTKDTNRSIHVGTNVIPLYNFSEILVPGRSYNLLVIPIASGLGTPNFKVVNQCITKKSDPNISINYDSNKNVLFNLKYNY